MNGRSGPGFVLKGDHSLQFCTGSSLRIAAVHTQCSIRNFGLVPGFRRNLREGRIYQFRSGYDVTVKGI